MFHTVNNGTPLIYAFIIAAAILVATGFICRWIIKRNFR